MTIPWTNGVELLTDLSGTPIPQYYNVTTGVMEPITGSGGSVDQALTGSNVTDAQAIPTRNAGTTDVITAQLTIGATATVLQVGASPLAGRTQLILYPPTAGTVYWGASGVTPSTGAPLAAGGTPVVFSLDPSVPLSVYAVNDGTSRTCPVVESK